MNNQVTEALERHRRNNYLVPDGFNPDLRARDEKILAGACLAFADHLHELTAVIEGLLTMPCGDNTPKMIAIRDAAKSRARDMCVRVTDGNWP